MRHSDPSIAMKSDIQILVALLIWKVKTNHSQVTSKFVMKFSPNSEHSVVSGSPSESYLRFWGRWREWRLRFTKIFTKTFLLRPADTFYIISLPLSHQIFSLILRQLSAATIGLGDNLSKWHFITKCNVPPNVIHWQILPNLGGYG